MFTISPALLDLTFRQCRARFSIFLNQVYLIPNAFPSYFTLSRVSLPGDQSACLTAKEGQTIIERYAQQAKPSWENATLL